jgi:MinD-like ATPase involved in chromosome partitioning or flagellar assembly
MIFNNEPRPMSFERIRVRMLMSGLFESDASAAILAFSTRLPREGISTVVAGLARSCGAVDPGGVLVLDTDSHQQRLTKRLKQEAIPFILDDIETEDVDLSSHIIQDKNLGISLLAVDSGRTAYRSIERRQILLDKLREKYRIILIDAGALTDGQASGWLNCSRSNILVIDTTTTTREMLYSTRNDLEKSGITFTGSILNKRVNYIPRYLYWLVR